MTGSEHEEALVGVISDTHGLLRPEALSALEGVDRILHAGDVGEVSILDDLAKIAPVTAVRGNVDHGAVAARLPATAALDLFDDGTTVLYVLHILEELDLDPGAADLTAIVHGHTHRPAEWTRDGVLYLNPGSAGPRRFDLPVTVARLRCRRDGLPDVEFLELDER